MLRMIITTLFAVAATFVAATPYPRQETTTAPVSTVSTTISPSYAGGQNITVIGTSVQGSKVSSWKGIPYAQPPIGSYRLARPVSPTTWENTINATQWTASCIQATNAFSALGPSSLSGDYGESEDCLYLNVFTPAGHESGSLPVLVFIPGGGFVQGTASTYDATQLLNTALSVGKPFVFVSLNYRLGFYGFPLGADAASLGLANLGIRDANLALSWVHDNIHAFGGNPSKVTISGQSAGAALCSILYLGQDYHYWNQAIMMSGSQTTVLTGPTERAPSIGFELLLNVTGCNHGNASAAFDCLRDVPSPQLNATLMNLTTTLKDPYLLGEPSIDADIIPGSPPALLANGSFLRYPFISSDVLDEGTILIGQNFTTEQGVRQYLLPQFNNSNATVDQIFQLYPNIPALGSPYGTGIQTFNISDVQKQAVSIFGDAFFQGPRRNFLHEASNHGMCEQTWSYQFDQEPPSAIHSPEYLGIYHTLDLSYFFGNFFEIPGEAEFTRDIQIPLIEFVVEGKPNCNNRDQVNWLPYNGEEKNILRFQKNNTAMFKDDYREVGIDYLITKEV